MARSSLRHLMRRIRRLARRRKTPVIPMHEIDAQLESLDLFHPTMPPRRYSHEMIDEANFRQQHSARMTSADRTLARLNPIVKEEEEEEEEEVIAGVETVPVFRSRPESMQPGEQLEMIETDEIASDDDSQVLASSGDTSDSSLCETDSFVSAWESLTSSAVSVKLENSHEGTTTAVTGAVTTSKVYDLTYYPDDEPLSAIVEDWFAESKPAVLENRPLTRAVLQLPPQGESGFKGESSCSSSCE